MRQSLRLGLRLAVSGGREGLVRLIFVAVGVGVGVGLVLLALAAPVAIGGRADRVAWQDAAYAMAYGDPREQPTPVSVDGALFLAVSDYYDGTPMTRAYVAALGDDPPAPPGLDRLPGPGEVAASPALAALIESLPDDQLADRFPGRVTLIIGPEGLAHDRELVGIIGRTPEQLADVGSVQRIYGFENLRPPGWAITAALRGVVFTGSIIVLVPVAILVVAVTRVAWRQRERRLAAIRLIGATRAQIALVAAAENALGAVLGAGLGWALYEAGRRVLAQIVVFQRGHFWLDDLAVPPIWLAVFLISVPLLTVATTMLSLRHVHLRPLAVSRRAGRRSPSVWRLTPLAVGLGGQFLLLPWRGQLGVSADDDAPNPLVGVSGLLTLLTVVGVVVAGPWLVMVIGRGIARLSRRLPALLAARRIAADPYATFRGVAAVGLAAAALAYLGSTVSVRATPETGGAARLAPGMVYAMTGGGASLAEIQSALPAHSVSSAVGPGVGEIVIQTDGSLAEENRVRTVIANLAPNAIINTDRDPIDYQLETFFADLDRLALIASVFVLIIGGFGLTVSMIAGLIERRRPFALLRASGVRVSELRRSLFLETTATMLVTSAVGVAIGMLLGYLSSRQSDVDWRWPGLELVGGIGGAVLAAMAFSTLALPLLSRATRPDLIRFE